MRIHLWINESPRVFSKCIKCLGAVATGPRPWTPLGEITARPKAPKAATKRASSQFPNQV